MPRILKDLQINEVSSVDRGAGLGVKVLLMKRDGAKPGDIEMTKEELDAAIAKAAKDGADAATANVTKVFQGELAKRDEQIMLLKMLPTHKAFYDGCADEATKKSFASMDDKGRDKFMADNPVKKAADPVNVEDLAKRDEVLKGVLAQNEALKKRLDAADLLASQADFKKRAADLGLTAEGDSEIMRKAFGGDAEAQAAFQKRQAEVVKGLTDQVKTGKLFSEFGSARTVSGGKAYDQIMEKARALQKTEAGKGLSEHQAFAKIYENPDNVELVQMHKRETLPNAN